MTIRFKIVEHSVTGADMVEVYDGDRFIAGIYAGNEKENGNQLRVVSKFLQDVAISSQFPPGVIIGMTYD